jgi:hypothetical protein
MTVYAGLAVGVNIFKIASQFELPSQMEMWILIQFVANKAVHVEMPNNTSVKDVLVSDCFIQTHAFFSHHLIC